MLLRVQIEDSELSTAWIKNIGMCELSFVVEDNGNNLLLIMGLTEAGVLIEMVEDALVERAKEFTKSIK